MYFLIYSAIFWTLYFIYQYKNNQEFKQKFVKWYLATFHGKKEASSSVLSVPSEFKVDFTTYKLPYKSSGGSHAKDYFKFTQEELKHYNGKDESLPLLLAIKGRVYDVSEGKSYYGMEGGYHFFAGRDGTRSFVTGCFDEEKEECTSVQSKYSDFTQEQMQSIEDWVKFYDDHEKYKFIGIVTDLKDQ
ncbi:predicted protein [Naegleria gruberi]|uniref:Predicted protein n=1 Tax=Naegleria gruberi TaxID=5762 RepID=D2UZB4_NAEGR|nr:uncharacterized protein NAEGRDRAFT_29788 [Naegleria gruberi]EFC50120.1 predicted protein [Naegleria gruberi]|eukprot:XP_002682864.1 predicted protein [Naegleria gruberi strain NEG-M]